MTEVGQLRPINDEHRRLTTAVGQAAADVRRALLYLADVDRKVPTRSFEDEIERLSVDLAAIEHRMTAAIDELVAEWTAEARRTGRPPAALDPTRPL